MTLCLVGFVSCSLRTDTGATDAAGKFCSLELVLPDLLRVPVIELSTFFQSW